MNEINNYEWDDVALVVFDCTFCSAVVVTVCGWLESRSMDPHTGSVHDVLYLGRSLFLYKVASEPSICML
jgi:hypothetical protein